MHNVNEVVIEMIQIIAHPRARRSVGHHASVAFQPRVWRDVTDGNNHMSKLNLTKLT